MKDDFRCEDNAALIGFLYDDCEADERERIAAHVAVCATCAGELAALSATRDHLSAWTPPDVQLGFHMNQVGAAPATHWWSRPMPAWAQLAAAVVIFAAGASVGSLSVRAVATTPGDVQAVRNAAAREDVTRIERRLTALERQQVNQPTAVRLDEQARDAILMSVGRQIRESEASMRVELATASLNVLRDSYNGVRDQLQQYRENRLQEDKVASQAVNALLNARNSD